MHPVLKRKIIKKELTNLTSVASPTRRAGTVEPSHGISVGYRVDLNDRTVAAVETRSRCTNVVNYLAIGARETVRALAQIFIRGRILASSTIQAGLVSSTII